MTPRKWAILSGEYPPTRGGVADHTLNLARGFSEAGDETLVVAPARGAGPDAEAEFAVPGVRVLRTQGIYDRADRRAIEAALRDFGAPRALLQFVPQSFGRRGINPLFASWFRRLPCERWVLFHEVSAPFGGPFAPKRNLMALATRAMAAGVAAAADRIFVTIPAWEARIRAVAPRLKPGKPPIDVLPVPSNLDETIDEEASHAFRAGLFPDPDGPIVGHFGTYGVATADLLRRILPAILRLPAAPRALLLGRGSVEFAREVASRLGEGEGGRIRALGETDASEGATALSACDLVVQPYTDGIGSRRTTATASLALGVPIVANRGFLTDPIWIEEGMAELTDDADAIPAAVARLLANPEARRRISERAKRIYRERFSIAATVGKLNAAADGRAEGAR